MSIYFGNDAVNDLYIGLTPVSKGYVGTHLFYNGDNTIINLTYEKYILNTEFSTLYNTAEKPVKSAILKGRTLINLFDINSISNAANGSGNQNINDWVVFKNNGGASSQTFYYNTIRQDIEIGKKYIAFLYVGENTIGEVTVAAAHSGYCLYPMSFNVSSPGVYKTTFIANATATNRKTKINFRCITSSSNVGEFKFRMLILKDEDVIGNQDFAYFEGMQSVKLPVLTTTGKNVFNPNWLINEDTKHAVSIVDGNVILNGEFTRSITWFDFKLPKGTYKATNFNTSDASIHVFWRGVDALFTHDKPFTYDTETTVKGYILKGTYVNHVLELQVESGTEQSTYEPFKSNILTTSEEVELRGVGDVKDELNLLTGELTQRVGEIVLNGSEDWVLSGMGNVSIFYTSLNNLAHKKYYLNSISCDKFPTYAGEGALNQSTSPNGIAGYIDSYDTYPNENWIYIKYADSEGSVANLKQLLSQDPVTVRYELTTPVTKTVDLSVVDQDGNDTELKTFNDITYVTLSSEGLIPVAELEVATKNEEVLNTMSLEMDDISATQTTLEETSNTQSENVDATMLATTEIYEQLL